MPRIEQVGEVLRRDLAKQAVVSLGCVVANRQTASGRLRGYGQHNIWFETHFNPQTQQCWSQRADAKAGVTSTRSSAELRLLEERLHVCIAFLTGAKTMRIIKR